MEGLADSHHRALYSELGGYDRFVAGFLRITDRLLADSVFYRICPELHNSGKTREGVPVYLQLLGSRPEAMAINAARAVALGASGIDLNFGCPAPIVNRHDGGAVLLKNPQRIFEVISAVRKSVPQNFPVTAKVRLGFHDKLQMVEIAMATAQAQVDLLVIHARTRDEGYRPPAHWAAIGRIKESVTIPIVANGEIWSVEDYFRCRELSGCSGVALGRGAIARPGLVWEIRKAIANEVSHPYQWTQVINVLLPRFIANLATTGPEPFVLARTKQWLKYLALNYPEGDRFFHKVKRSEKINDILNIQD